MPATVTVLLARSVLDEIFPFLLESTPASNQVINEMVVDGGGHFNPAGIDGVYTLNLLLSSHTAHGRAEGNPHTHSNNYN